MGAEVSDGMVAIDWMPPSGRKMCATSWTIDAERRFAEGERLVGSNERELQACRTGKLQAMPCRDDRTLIIINPKCDNVVAVPVGHQEEGSARVNGKSTGFLTLGCGAINMGKPSSRLVDSIERDAVMAPVGTE